MDLFGSRAENILSGGAPESGAELATPLKGGACDWSLDSATRAR
ncbi:hypothetical protein AB0I54_05630 [Streptomyces sp. NPDC050625]